ncbi:MAG TPA: hypothetical protein VKR60_15540 [Candidatus Sulfotelmatobacter sp.]|nr:hypothetical protein [Candidatus Sulfotelmatobacter sp.]
MAVVFDGKTKIGRAVADPGTDKTLPFPGSLSWGGITGPSALLTTIGIDAKLVRGTRWEQIAGVQTDNFMADLIITITGNETVTVDQNQTYTTYGTLTENMYGNAIYVFISPQDVTNVATVTLNYSSPIAAQQPSSSFQNYNWMGATYDLNLQICIFNTQIAALNFQAYFQNYQFNVTSFGMNAITFQVNGLETKCDALENAMKALGSALHGLAAKVGGPRIFGVAAKVLGCAILGPNQIL